MSITKLFISGYPLSTDELQLARLVAPHGDIATLKIVRDKATRKPKGYAFIEMVDRKAAENVREALNGAEMAGQELTVNIVEADTAPAPPVYKKPTYQSGPPRPKRPRRPLD